MKQRFTEDGRYLVVRGRLWRAADPTLPPDTRDAKDYRRHRVENSPYAGWHRDAHASQVPGEPRQATSGSDNTE